MIYQYLFSIKDTDKVIIKKGRILSAANFGPLGSKCVTYEEVYTICDQIRTGFRVIATRAFAFHLVYLTVYMASSCEQQRHWSIPTISHAALSFFMFAYALRPGFM